MSKIMRVIKMVFTSRIGIDNTIIILVMHFNAFLKINVVIVLKCAKLIIRGVYSSRM